MAETETSAPDIPDPSRTCRECQQPTPPDDVEFEIGSGIQVVCWRCASTWPDAPMALRERREREDDLVAQTAEIRDAPVPEGAPDQGPYPLAGGG